MCRRAAKVPWTCPRYVTSVTRRISSGLRAVAGPKTDAMALLIQTSMRPHRATISAAAASIAPASATSAGITRACPPASSTAWAALARRSGPRAIKATRQPFRPNATATARPTPAEAPVMATTEPAAERMGSSFRTRASVRDR
jgi:hypothetical protein